MGHPLFNRVRLHSLILCNKQLTGSRLVYRGERILVGGTAGYSSHNAKFW